MVLMGFYRFFFVYTDSNGSLCVLIRRYSSIWFLMDPYGPLSTLMGLYWSS